MKTLITLFLLVGLTAPILAAEKKSTAKKPAAEKKTDEKKAAPAEDKPSAKSEAEAKSLTPTQKTKLMAVINTGDDKALMSIPGIGETRAAAVKKARPVAEVLDLLKIEGIGEATFSDIIKHAKSGMPASEESSKSATKSESKPKGKTKPKSTKK